MPDLLVVFEGIHQTLRAEGMIRARGVETRLVPTPPAVSLGCRFSILVSGSGNELPVWWLEMETRRAAYRVIIREGAKAYEEVDRREGACLPQARDHEPKGDRSGGAG